MNVIKKKGVFIDLQSSLHWPFVLLDLPAALCAPIMQAHKLNLHFLCFLFPSDTLEVSSNQPPLGSTHCTHTILTSELLKDTHLPGPRTAIKAISSFLRQVKSEVLIWEFWFELCKGRTAEKKIKKSEEDRKEPNPLLLEGTFYKGNCTGGTVTSDETKETDT